MNIRILSLTLSFLLIGLFSYGQTAITTYGSGAGTNLSTGDYDSFFGYYAGNATTTGSYNSFFGANAGRSTTSAFSNTFIGYNAGRDNTSGGYNATLGAFSAYNNTTGNRNVFVGLGAGYDNTTGFRNVVMGYYAGGNNTTGDYNVYIGNEAGYNETTASNKLYIANNRTDNLIYGDFSSNQVGINTKVLGTHTLSVNGSVRAEEVVIETGWADFVFEADHKLPTIEEEEQHIADNGHLSGFESADDMNGEIKLADVTVKQQVKIEEMMLHLIDMKKQLDATNQRLAKVEAENELLKANK